MKARFASIILAMAPFVCWSQNYTGNYWIADGSLNVGYTAPNLMTKTQIDNSSSTFGNQGLGALNAGDVHLRGYWGVVIDKNAGNYGESGFYTNGVLPAGGTFAVRTRTSTTNFRTDFIIRHNGNTGIGNTNPLARLQVSEGDVLLQNTVTGYPRLWLKDVSGNNTLKLDYNSIIGTGSNMLIRSGSGTNLLFNDEPGGGKVGIGTSNPDQKLTVKGKIHAEEVIIDLSVPAPDYVFENSYDLKSLDEVEHYINKNKHLPEVPSAKEMEQDGLKVGEMEMVLLKKVEELTLYILQLRKENEQLKNNFSNELIKLKSQIAELKK